MIEGMSGSIQAANEEKAEEKARKAQKETEEESATGIDEMMRKWNEGTS